MEARDAEIFVAVAEELHFGRAAERLRIAQPAVTRGVRRLESELGAVLFTRTTRRVALTIAGIALLDPARALLVARQEAVDAVHAAERGELGTVHVIFAGASTHVMVGRLARQIHARLPALDLRLESGNYVTQDIRRIVNGEADIGLGRWDFIPRGVRTRVVAADSFRVALPVDHPLAGRRAIRLRDLEQDPFVTLPHEGNWLSAQLDRLARADGFEPIIAMEAPDSWTLMALVAEGIGCALTLSSIAEVAREDRIAFLPLRDPEPAGDTRIGWAAGPLTPAVRSVLAIATEVLPTPDA